MEFSLTIKDFDINTMSWFSIKHLQKENEELMNFNVIFLVFQELTAIFEEKKHSYETANAGLESNMAKLEQVICCEHITWLLNNDYD